MWCITLSSSDDRWLLTWRVKLVYGSLRGGHKYLALGCIFTFSPSRWSLLSTALIPHLNILVDHLIAHMVKDMVLSASLLVRSLSFQETLYLFSNSLNRRRFMPFCIQYSTIGGLPDIFDLWMPLSSLSLPVALLWYDYTLTWTREVQYFWMKRFKLSTLLYVLCRYGMVAKVFYTLAIADKLPTMRVRFWSYWVVAELKHVASIRTSFLTMLTWHLYFRIYSCDTGYQICAILSVLGRIGIISEWILFPLRSSLMDLITITSSSFPLCSLNTQPYGVREHMPCLIKARLFSSYLALLNWLLSASQ